MGSYTSTPPTKHSEELLDEAKPSRGAPTTNRFRRNGGGEMNPEGVHLTDDISTTHFGGTSRRGEAEVEKFRRQIKRRKWKNGTTSEASTLKNPKGVFLKLKPTTYRPKADIFFCRLFFSKEKSRL